MSARRERRIDRLFDQLLERGGSDLHLTPGYPPMLRVRGELVPEGDRPLSSDEIEAMLLPLLGPRPARASSRRPAISTSRTRTARRRASAPTTCSKLTGTGAVFRAIPTIIKTLDELGVPPGVRKLAELRAGLVLVTGPTGRGKSTTLAAMIDHINRTRPATS